jgi:hypothetical protein
VKTKSGLNITSLAAASTTTLESVWAMPLGLCRWGRDGTQYIIEQTVMPYVPARRSPKCQDCMPLRLFRHRLWRVFVTSAHQLGDADEISNLNFVQRNGFLTTNRGRLLEHLRSHVLVPTIPDTTMQFLANVVVQQIFFEPKMGGQDV